MKEYIIDTISKETIEEYGYDSSQVSDEMMKNIAALLRHTFRECVLVNLPQIAEDYEIPESQRQCYTVSRMYVSLNDEDGNIHDTILFYNREKAEKQLRRWRNDEMLLRKESGCDYEVVYDDNDRFHLTWDNGRELLVLGINRVFCRN